MPPHDAVGFAFRDDLRREDVLPDPFAIGKGIFSGMHIGEIDAPMAFFQVSLVQILDANKMFLQGGNHRLRQQGDPVLCAFAIANQDLPLCKVDVLNTQPNNFADSQAAAVQQLADDLGGPGHPF